MGSFSYSNKNTRWTFTETGEPLAYDFKAILLPSNTEHAVGKGYFSDGGLRTFVVGFKQISNGSIGYAVITGKTESGINVETKNPDGTTRWRGTLELERPGGEWE